MQIFLSYSWSDEFEADKVDNALRKKGYRVVRDKRNVEFKGNITNLFSVYTLKHSLQLLANILIFVILTRYRPNLRGLDNLRSQ